MRSSFRSSWRTRRHLDPLSLSFGASEYSRSGEALQGALPKTGSPSCEPETGSAGSTSPAAPRAKSTQRRPPQAGSNPAEADRANSPPIGRKVSGSTLVGFSRCNTLGSITSNLSLFSRTNEKKRRHLIMYRLCGLIPVSVSTGMILINDLRPIAALTQDKER